MLLHNLGLRVRDFKGFAQEITGELCQVTEQRARESGRPYQYLNSTALRKEIVAREIAERDGIEQGLICVLGCVEPCSTFGICTNPRTGYADFRLLQRKCLHYYHYFMHEKLGLMHVRLQTWLPFSVHICLNGRHWLQRQMDRAGMRYSPRENTFTWIDNIVWAQQLMDQQLRTDWPKLLNGLLKSAHPLDSGRFADWPYLRHWTVEESEWATDVMFHDAAELGALYPRLVRHGMELFGSREVMRFLERKLPSFRGQVRSDLAVRGEGLRIRHQVNQNAIKMYNKGPVLRVETTINDPSDFKVYRAAEGDPGGEMRWRPMRKGVADLPRRCEASQRANQRYLEGLAEASTARTLAELSDPLCQPVTWKGRQVRALNPLSGDDLGLLQAVGKGEYLINGLRNRDLRQTLYGAQPLDAKEKRRQSAAVTRKLRLLRAHGLIHKVPRTHRYMISPQGQAVLAALVTARHANVEKLAKAA